MTLMSKKDQSPKGVLSSKKLLRKEWPKKTDYVIQDFVMLDLVDVTRFAKPIIYIDK